MIALLMIVIVGIAVAGTSPGWRLSDQFSIAKSYVLSGFEWFGQLGLFCGRLIRSAVRPPYEFRELIRQCDAIGAKSFPLVALAGAATGVVMSLQMREVKQEETKGETSRGLRLFGSHVNFRTQNTFTYTAEGSSSVTAIIRPVPPPSRLVPSIVTVNALVQPPAVTINP